jgi:hypothetical protein
MTVQNLYFFDKFGKNLNFLFNQDKNIWEGKIFFEQVSNYLFDNENLFILEKVSSVWKFPTLQSGEALEFSWSNQKNNDIFFIYEVEKDLDLNENFIKRQESLNISHFGLTQGNISSSLDIRSPLQINIAFSPNDEIAFERTLEIYLINSLGKTKIAEIGFYGEGVEEDERFKNWAQNFGIRFLKEDANLLKDYDIKEALPNLEKLNQIRKELLVNKEEIYPYIGTYRGLVNFVNLLGYKDVLSIKEYWKNINLLSPYYNKLLMVDLADYLDDGKINNIDFLDKNIDIKESRQFVKTEFLALVYQFTKVDGTFDADGIPNVVETTEFSVNEIFYKLNLLGDKVKNEFLPINVKIKDIIGEFIYFQKISILYWRDDTHIFSHDYNSGVDVTYFPGESSNLHLRSLDPLFRKVDDLGIDFGVGLINKNKSPNPFEWNQKYSREDSLKLNDNIREFYTQIKNQSFPNIGQRLTWEFGDDPERIIGAPVILKADFKKLTLFDLRGVKLEDLDEIAPGLNKYWTLENIDFKNVYEINWKITKPGPNPYSWEYRDKTVNIYEIPHVFPYAGKYRVTVELIDFCGNISAFSRFITVQDDLKPRIIAFSRLEDKFNYQVQNLKNVQLKDFGASPIYYPKVNVLNNEDAAVKIDIFKNLLEWISFYKNRYGMGQNLYDVEIYDQNINRYLSYFDPNQNHPKLDLWGLGSGQIPIQIKDYRDITLDELYWMRLTDLVYLDDFKAGFYIENPKPGDTIKISLFSEYIIPQFNLLDELIQILNDSNHPGIRLFNYEIINGQVHAQAEYLSKEMYHILSPVGRFSPSPSPSPSGSRNKLDEYTFFLPKNVFSKKLVNLLKKLSPVFDDETLFLFAKTSDVLTGAVQDPTFWRDTKYWKFVNDQQIGYLPTTIDQNAFNINDIKLFEDSFVVPENAIVFFVINNLDGKSEFVWNLKETSTNQEIIRVRSVPFFAWKFKDLGEFNLSIEAIDNRNTRYSNEIKNFIKVYDKIDYQKYVEDRLNDRKLVLSNS